MLLKRLLGFIIDIHSRLERFLSELYWGDPEAGRRLRTRQRKD